MVAAKLVSSKGDAKRNIEQKGVAVDDVVVTDLNAQLSAGTHVVRVGKNRFARVVVA
jgi:tyrosyl-tRNA synthetase